jgi:transcriptional regulator with XRE-family HTH domain
MSLAAIDFADSDDEDVAAETALNCDGGRRRDVQRDAGGAGPAAVQGPLGRLVRAHRARLGLTQEEVAQRAGLSERTLRNLEAGRSSRPYPDTIRRLADALELTARHRHELEAAARGVVPGLGPEGGRFLKTLGGHRRYPAAEIRQLAAELQVQPTA